MGFQCHIVIVGVGKGLAIPGGCWRQQCVDYTDCLRVEAVSQIVGEGRGIKSMRGWAGVIHNASAIEP